MQKFPFGRPREALGWRERKEWAEKFTVYFKCWRQFQKKTMSWTRLKLYSLLTQLINKPINFSKESCPKCTHSYSPPSPGPPQWSSGQSSWLQIQRSGFDFRRYQIFWEVVGLERGPLSLVSTIEELLERRSSGSGLEDQEYGPRNLSRWPRGTLYPQKLPLTSPTSGSRSVSIIRSRTQATEFVILLREWRM
jgi:hypothetical protein